MSALGLDAWITIAVIVSTMALLLWERFGPEFVLMAAVAVLLLTGVLTPVQALAGFSNTAVLTVAVLFIVAAALRATGAIRWIGAWVLGRPRGAFLAQARLVGVSSTLSAFVNNTPVVAMLTSAVEDWSRKSGVPVSRLLLPLSYATILGGLCSLIGTSTNLIIDGLAQAYPNLPPLKMFDPAWVGIPAALAGMLYLLTVGRVLLPDRRGAVEQARDTREYVLEMVVEPAGPLSGQRLGDAGLFHQRGLFLAEIQREGHLLPALNSDTRLRDGDRLVFIGVADGLRAIRQLAGLRHAEDEVFKIGGVQGRHFVEAVLSRLSPMVGRTLREGHFRHRYDAVVVAVNRRGRQLAEKPGNVVLHPGDTLLLETTPDFMARHAHSHEFSMVNLLDDPLPVQRGRALLSLAILAGMIAANTLLGVNIFVSALIAALAMLVTGCLPLRDARHAVDWPLIVVIACAFAIGKALETTGVAAVVADALMHGAGGDPMRTLILLYACTVVFTEVLTNNAAAVLMFPIGMAASSQLGVAPMPFVMTIMVASSAAFITPLGYQTNLMVYGPGGYRFIDYVRVGTPLSLLVGTVVLWVIPHVWPFA